MENIFTASTRILTLSKVFGCFPMSFEGHPVKGSLKINWQGVFYSASCLVVLIYLVLRSVSFSFMFLVNTEILFRAWKFLTNLEFISYVVMLCYNNFKCKNMPKLLKELHSSDEEVNKKSKMLSN